MADELPCSANTEKAGVGAPLVGAQKVGGGRAQGTAPTTAWSRIAPACYLLASSRDTIFK